jgi:lysophospholipase L1-like esterase
MHYVAIGDSFTEGVGDDLPTGDVRGWADLVAAGLAASGKEVWYANLAIRGRLIGPIIDEQLEPALALSPTPTLMTFNGGGNDMMRRGFDADRVIELTRHVIDRCGEMGTTLVLLSGGDPTDGLPRGDMLTSRANEFMDRVGELAEGHEHVILVDNYSDKELRRPQYWAEDRLHLNALGHARVAARVLTALGVETELPVAESSASLRRGVLVEARYVARHVLPWIGRRLTGRSSGDGRVPKHPDWVRIDTAV